MATLPGEDQGEDARGGDCDVLVVGAGPTGLALAAALSAFDVDLRVVDAALDRAHESRALAVQPRTLEVLRPFGVDRALVERGDPAVRLRLSLDGRVLHAPLFDTRTDDTAFPFILFVSQAETEAVLGEHLAARGVEVRRGVALTSSCQDGDRLLCSLQRADGAREVVRARYVVGCDGARSTVREQAGIAFPGGRYPQTFLLADLAADGLEDGAVNAHLGPDGPLLFFPLGRPAPWRLVTARAADSAHAGSRQVALAELQQVSDRATGGAVRLHDPVWTSAFAVHHRVAVRYRAGRVLLAGDAAHVHSPVGAQGMNTGIQDAVNLGWKLALVCRGTAPEALLDSYDAERRPVGEAALRTTDRAFTAVTSARPLVAAVRTRVVPRVLPGALRLRVLRARAFRTVSQLDVRYRRSPAVQPARRPWLGRLGGWLRGGRGPRPGDRLPDARVRRGGTRTWLQEALTAPAFHVLLCGPAGAWDDADVERLDRLSPLVVVHRLAAHDDPDRDDRAHPCDLEDDSGEALARLGVRGAACFVVRPDGHVGHRADGADLRGAQDFLRRWLPQRGG